MFEANQISLSPSVLACWLLYSCFLSQQMLVPLLCMPCEPRWKLYVWLQDLWFMSHNLHCYTLSCYLICVLLCAFSDPSACLSTCNSKYVNKSSHNSIFLNLSLHLFVFVLQMFSLQALCLSLQCLGSSGLRSPSWKRNFNRLKKTFP